MPPGWISGRVRAIEPWALVALSFSMAATAVFLWPGLPASWALALVPLLAARWSQSGPARHAGELALRGTLVVVGVLLLQLHRPDDAGAAALLTQAWVAAACAAYAFLLPPVWAGGIASVALLVLATARLLAAEPTAQPTAMAEDALLVVLPAVLAALPGAALRRTDWRRESVRLDAATGLYNLAGLNEHGEGLLARSRRRGQPSTLAVFDCSDLLEVRHIYGGRVALRLALRAAAELTRIAGERGMAARSGSTEFTVLLPGLDGERAVRAIQQVLGSPARLEFESGRNEIVLLPQVLVQQAGQEDELAELHAKASRALTSTREREARRQDHMRRERERHSRPMSLSPYDAQAARERALAPTVPMPLAAS
jgi:GGDEF domain-containing protein